MNERLLKATDKEMAEIVLVSTKYNLKYQRFLTDEAIQLFNNTFVELTNKGVIRLNEFGEPEICGEIDIEPLEEQADLEMFRKKFFKKNIGIDNRYTVPSTPEYEELVSLWHEALSKYTYEEIMKAADAYINEYLKSGTPEYIGKDRTFLERKLEVYVDFIRSEKDKQNKDGIYYD